eukprot:459381_1
MATPKTQKHVDQNFESSKTWFRLERLDEDNLNDIKSLNLVVLPINYSSKFYKRIIFKGFGYLVIDNKTDQVIGGCCIMIENDNKIYIATIGVYASWRRNGIGSMLMNKIQNECIHKNIKNIILHCQCNDSNVIKFYKSNGFVVTRKIDNFYQKLHGSASNAVEMTKTIH